MQAKLILEIPVGIPKLSFHFLSNFRSSYNGHLTHLNSRRKTDRGQGLTTEA